MRNYDSLGELVREIKNKTYTDFIEKDYIKGLNPDNLPVIIEYVGPKVGILSILISLIVVELDNKPGFPECYKTIRRKIIESILKALDLTDIIDDVRNGKVYEYCNVKYRYTEYTKDLAKRLKEYKWIEYFYGFHYKVIHSRYTDDFYKVLERFIVYELYKIQSIPIDILEKFTDLMVKCIDEDSVYPSELIESKIDKSRYKYYYSCKSIEDIDRVNECELDLLSKMPGNIEFLLDRCKKYNISLSEIIKMYYDD